MPRATCNGIEIEYETFGDRGGEPLLLIMGLATQMVLWEVGFCEELVRRGFFVVRFDNRDVGKSTKMTEAGGMAALAALVAAQAGEPVDVPYTLQDMADDALGLMDALGLERAHVVGASMGGMIAQLLTIGHPERVSSLTSIMSTTSDRSLPQADPEVAEVLFLPRPDDRDGAVAVGLEVWRKLRSPACEFKEDKLRGLLGLQYDRGHHPPGAERQLVAILGTESRREPLRTLRVPTLVIHGDSDTLILPEHGRDTAACVPGAELVMVEGMGHCMEEELWPTLIGAIERHARAASSR